MAARSPPRLSRCRPVVRPLLAGCGATPQSLAKAASLRMSLGVVAGCHEELAGELDTDAEQLDEFGGGESDEVLDLPVEGLDLLIECSSSGGPGHAARS